MTITDQRSPPPTIDQLRKLQLMRTSLVTLLESRDFNEAIRHCYVRVLLEMRSDRGSIEEGCESRDNGATPSNATTDNYYIARVKGGKKGPSYTGFSCDGASTEWHVEIELPPIFRVTTNGNILQLNSISNTVFKNSEYQRWIQMSNEHGRGMITNAQLELRLCGLEEELRRVNATSISIHSKRRREEEEAGSNGAIHVDQEENIAMTIKSLDTEVRSQQYLMCLPERLSQKSINELMEVEQQCLDVISTIRVALNIRTKCRHCLKNVACVVFCPCKHQVVCKECMNAVTHCPAPDCGEFIQVRFDVYTS